MSRVGGLLFVKVNGVQFKAKATSWTINYGVPKKEGIVGVDQVHGYKELPTQPFIEGTITDDSDLDVKSLIGQRDVTVTAELANGKVAVFRNAWFAGDTDITTEEGEIPFRFEALSAEEVA